MERITPNDAHSQHSSSLTSNAAKTSNTLGGGSGGGSDPFGDSFTSFPVYFKNMFLIVITKIQLFLLDLTTSRAGTFTQ